MTGKTKISPLTALLASFFVVSPPSHAASTAGKVLVTTDNKTPNQKTEQSKNQLESFRVKVQEDGLRAAKMLRETVCDASPLSPWAAVYLRRLKIRHDESCASAALLKGTVSDDPLLQALCWRHLTSSRKIALPRWRPDKTRDPGVKALAAIAYASRGSVPNSLRFALALPAGKPAGKNKKRAVEKRTNHLGALSTPFDDGPVAIAAAFVEMREQECSISKGKSKQHAAKALREALLNALGKNSAGIAAKLPETPSEKAGPGQLGVRLDNPLVTRPPETLRAIALTGSSTLRKEGLRAIAVVAKKPVAGDLAAAAAALSSPDPSIRLEGARTFLLLLKRTQ